MLARVLSGNLSLSYAARQSLLLRLAIGLLVVAASFLYVSTFKATYIDDAYIQLQYANNVATHGTWGMFPDRVANTATSPLNVLLLAFFVRLTGDAMTAITWLTTVAFSTIIWLLFLISRRLFDNRYFGAFASIAFVTNPLLLSTIGLEGITYTLFFIASLYFFLVRKWLPLAVSLGLLTLTRPDGALLFVLLFLLLPASWAEKWKMALAYLLVLTPWHLYAWVQLGSIIPDTLIIKAQQRWGDDTFQGGLPLYLRAFPVATLSSFFLLPLGLLLWRFGRDRNTRVIAGIAGAYGLLHFSAYTVMGVPPYHWYYLHQMIPAVLIGSLGIAALVSSPSLAKYASLRRGSYVALVLPAIGLLSLYVAQGFPLRQAPINTNWADSERYKEVGTWLRDNLPPSAVIALSGEVGTLAFYSDRYLVNEFSDLNIMNNIIANTGFLKRSPVDAVFRVIFAWRQPQPPLPPTSYILEHQACFAECGELPAKGDQDIMTWDTSTKWAPKGRIYLRAAENQ